MRTGREVRIGEEPAGGKCMHNGDKERGLGDEDRERGEDRGRASWVVSACTIVMGTRIMMLKVESGRE